MYYKLFVLVAIFTLSSSLGGCTLIQNFSLQSENNEGLYSTPNKVNEYEEEVPNYNNNPDPTITVKEDSSLDELDSTLNDIDNLENVNIETFDIEN